MQKVKNLNNWTQIQNGKSLWQNQKLKHFNRWITTVMFFVQATDLIKCVPKLCWYTVVPVRIWFSAHKHISSPLNYLCVCVPSTKPRKQCHIGWSSFMDCAVFVCPFRLFHICSVNALYILLYVNYFFLLVQAFHLNIDDFNNHILTLLECCIIRIHLLRFIILVTAK